MLPIQMDLRRKKTCGACRKAFQKQTLFLDLGDRSYYCEACARERVQKPYRKHLSYMMQNHMGQLVLDWYSFEEIENGVYHCIWQEHMVLQQKQWLVPREAGSLTGSDFLFEKRDGNAAFLFPESYRVHCYDPDFREKLPKFARKLLGAITGCNNYHLLLDEKNQAVGISSLSKEEMQDSEFLLADFAEDTPTLLSLMRGLSQERINADIWCALQKFTPQEMLQYCQKRIQGQNTSLKIAVYQVYRYLQLVAVGKPFSAQNWLLTAPSGSGKTEFFRAIRDFCELHRIILPVVQIDLSRLTEEGFKGNDASKIPEQILAKYPDSKGYGICFLDEADKKCLPCYTSHGENVNAAVQGNLLTLVEGCQVLADTDSGKKIFDSSYTMFIFMGAFQSVRNQKAQKTEATRRLGFLAEETGSADTLDNSADSFYEDITLQDIIDCGMQEELAGRLSQVVNFHRISKDDMRKLLFHKAEEISRETGICTELTQAAAEDFLQISFGNLGIRRPMNQMRQLVQNAVAEVFFENGFDCQHDKVVIASVQSAYVVQRTSYHADTPDTQRAAG